MLDSLGADVAYGRQRRRVARMKLKRTHAPASPARKFRFLPRPLQTLADAGFDLAGRCAAGGEGSAFLESVLEKRPSGLSA